MTETTHIYFVDDFTKAKYVCFVEERFQKFPGQHVVISFKNEWKGKSFFKKTSIILHGLGNAQDQEAVLAEILAQYPNSKKYFMAPRMQKHSNNKALFDGSVQVSFFHFLLAGLFHFRKRSRWLRLALVNKIQKKPL